MDDSASVAYALEDLRLAESRLERRREAISAPSATDRAALRFAFERYDGGDAASPSDLADHLGLSRSAVSLMLRRLVEAGTLRLELHPHDGRKRMLVPVSRNDHLDGDDALTDRMRAVASRLSGDEARVVTAFLEELREVIDRTDVPVSGMS